MTIRDIINVNENIYFLGSLSVDTLAEVRTTGGSVMPGGYGARAEYKWQKGGATINVTGEGETVDAALVNLEDNLNKMWEWMEK